MDLKGFPTYLNNIQSTSGGRVELTLSEIWCILVHGERDSKLLKKVSDNWGVKSSVRQLAYLPYIYLSNIKRLPCLHSLMHEGGLASTSALASDCRLSCQDVR